MIDMYTRTQEIVRLAELGALAIYRLQDPGFDQVNLTEAYRIAGSERWLKWHIKHGNIRGVRSGHAKNSPIYYSRLEIAALKKAEADAAAEFKEREKQEPINLLNLLK